MKRSKPDLSQTVYRDFSIKKDTINEEKRTAELAFSSDAELPRYGGLEILDHSPGSVRLDRLKNGAPLLVNHDSNDQVGVVESVRIDDDAVGRAVVRFSGSTRGREIFQDVMDGIRQLVSVGYRIHSIDEERYERTGDILATDWEPHEVSIVPIPFDISVGVGRSDETLKTEHKKEVPTMDTETTEVKTESRSAETSTASTFDIKKERGEGAKAERERANKIRSTAENFELDSVSELAVRAIDEGWSPEQFNKEALDEIGKHNNEVRSEYRPDDRVGAEEKDVKEFSFSRLMRAVADPDDRSAQRNAGYELEICRAAEDKLGSEFKVRGVYIPSDILGNSEYKATRDLNVGTATAGGNLVATNLLAGSFIELLRNSQITAQAGVQTIPGLVGNVDIPRQTGGSAMAWLAAEDGEAAESEATFDQVSLTPKDAAVFTEATRRLLMQSTPAVDGLIKADLAQAIGLGTDIAVLYGSGAAGQPTGVANQTGINSTTFAAADPTYAEIVAMKKEVMLDNALGGSLSYMCDPEGWEALMTTEKATNTAQFIMSPDGTVLGHNTFVSNQITAEDYFFGNFNSVIVGEWGGLEMNIDPYTHALRGRVRYIVFKTMDVAVRHPESFCLSNDTP
jgi:HK97 family phage major capsid protein